MSLEVFDTKNTLVQLTMVLKLQQLQREALPSISYRNLEDYLDLRLWKRETPARLNIAVDQILAIQPQEIVRFLSAKAITDGARLKLDDFGDIIGGD